MDELHAIQHPHDALFRGVFGDPERAGELLRSTLPDAVTAAIDWATLRAVEGSFVDEALRGQQADLLIRATAQGRATLLYVLLEHKADDDRFTALQLLRDVVRIWQRCRRDEPERPRLPPVLPLVLHHGPRPWRSPRDLRALLDLDGVPSEFTAQQPSFWFPVDDLTAQGEHALHQRRLSVCTLLPLLHLQWLRRRADTANLLRSWQTLYRALLAVPGGREIAYRLVSYTAAVSNEPTERLRLAFADLEPAMEAKYMTAAEQLMQQGAIAATTKLLLTQLEQRFGLLPEAMIERLRKSTPAELDRIARTVLTAPTLAAVFAD
ncbi:MAG: Rpn family recombination-promoting nuclease/putative transposase [Planctomycetes bacterium]|nr:Rpn family recombination-promoting nuclease/putative transposase [Planctomycetota bacterium]